MKRGQIYFSWKGDCVERGQIYFFTGCTGWEKINLSPFHAVPFSVQKINLSPV